MVIKNQDDLLLCIKHYMLDKNIKQKDIVNVTGLTKATISNTLNGRSNLTLATLLNITDAIDCQIDINLVSKQSNKDSK